ncbi:hypothetical protein JG687_00015573 [Phytophthora cactorum]|uniref:Uncharacterized protein n=1 Tax=Phytophthora cactorum TaxID=29920 RepID=A0A8T1TYG5_9STRA|nr:hypothetical protein JG687_00015573 [Phytophthora cactorum]
MKERCHSHRVVHAVVDELCTAATSLGIDSVITRAVIEERIYLFGYVARECLALDEDFVMKLFSELEQTVRGMDSLPALTRLVSEKAGATTRHDLRYYVPVLDNPSRCHDRIASAFVSRRMHEGIYAIKNEEQHLWRRYLRGFFPEPATYRGHLSGMEMHEVLKRGGKIHTIQLSAHPGTGQTQIFDVKKSKKLYFFDPKTLSKAELSKGPYNVARTGAYHNFGDSIYEPRRLHPVNGQGIVTVFKKLELLETALNNRRVIQRCLQSVRVVFAVPNSEENKVESKQPIRWNPFANFENVDFIPDVGPVETNQLKAANVRTVRGLRRAGDAPSTQQRTFFSPEVLTRYTAILKSFDERQKSIESMLTKIPQYVWKT